MMKSFWFFIFFSVLLMGNPKSSIASDSFSAYTHTNTHTNALELKPASLSGAYKTAAVCFLGFGDCDPNVGFGKGDDYSRDPEQMCREEGFIKTSCTIPEYLYNQCPYDKRFYKECRLDNAKACIDSGYSQACGLGYLPDYSQTCPYDSSYKKCKCDPCSGFDYTYGQATADGYMAGASCDSCGTTKYKRSNSSCSGFLTCNCGSEIGSPSCKSGTNTLYKTCKSCCTPSSCGGYNLYTCPSGSNCEICDQGCGSGNKYRFSSCQSGYYLSGGSCKICGTNTSCPTGESLVNICKIDGTNKGDCANCRDENSSLNPCNGYYICDSSKVGDGKTCDCGGIIYYERCLVPETCNEDRGKYNGISHGAFSENSVLLTSYGYYKVAEKCTRQNGTKIYWGQICTNKDLDGNGNYGPCKGKIDCGVEKGTGACSCGGETFYDTGSCCNEDRGKYNGISHGAFSENSVLFTSSGYYKVAEKCTRQNGTKIYWGQICTDTNLDGNGNYGPCKGKIDCGIEKGTGACSCGGKTFYDKGSCCNEDGGTYNGIYHDAYSENSVLFTSSGYYKVAEKCTRQNGTKIYWLKICTNTVLDGNGNYGPCKGKIDCKNDFAVGDICTCGGKTFGTACATTCNYEETPQSCSSKGKSFTFKCGNLEGLKYGVCN